jgi:hypothetical protein
MCLFCNNFELFRYTSFFFLFYYKYRNMSENTVSSNEILKVSKDVYDELVQDTFINTNSETSFSSRDSLVRALDNVRFRNEEFRQRVNELKRGEIDWFDGHFEQSDKIVKGKKLNQEYGVKLVFVKVEKNDTVPFTVQTFYPVID